MRKIIPRSQGSEHERQSADETGTDEALSWPQTSSVSAGRPRTYACSLRRLYMGRRKRWGGEKEEDEGQTIQLPQGCLLRTAYQIGSGSSSPYVSDFLSPLLPPFFPSHLLHPIPDFSPAISEPDSLSPRHNLYILACKHTQSLSPSIPSLPTIPKFTHNHGSISACRGASIVIFIPPSQTIQPTMMTPSKHHLV